MNAEEAPPPEGGGASREAMVRRILEELFDAGAASVTAAAPANARRIALHHAHEQIWATMPKEAWL